MTKDQTESDQIKAKIAKLRAENDARSDKTRRSLDKLKTALDDKDNDNTEHDIND